MKRWFAMTAQFTKDAKIEQLGEELGPGGPLALVVLMGQAKIQANGGRVEGTFRDLAHDAFIDRPDAQRTLERAAETGVIEVESTDERGFVAKFPNWRRYQEAFRKQEGRPDPQLSADPRNDAQEGADSPQGEAPTGTETGTTTRTEPQQQTFEVPPALAPFVATLNRVAEGKSAKPVKPQLAAKAFGDFADRDIAAELPEFEHYWLHGKGGKKQLSDVVGACRRWLRRSDPVGVANGRPKGTAASRADADIARLEAEKVRLEAAGL